MKRHTITDDERDEFRVRKPKLVRCSDRMCGADDCPNCHPENTMNPMLNYSPTATHECQCCGHEIEVDYSKLKSSNERVRCPHCNALYGVDVDAEYVGGVWTDKTKLWRV